MQQNYVLGTPKFTNESPTEPVLLGEMKTYLRISPDETFNDTLITQLIKTARQQLETYLNLSLIDKTVTARLQNDVGYMQLPYSAPVITISSVTDNDGNAVAATGYSLKGNTFSGYTSPGTPANNFYSPCNFIVTVVYDVSYDNGLPEHFKTLIMQQVSWIYEHRGDELALQLSPVVKISAKPYRNVI